MIARGDFACTDVEDKRNQGRMELRETHEHAKAGPRMPLGDGFSICNIVVKYIHGAAEGVGTGKIGVGKAIAGPKFDGGDARVDVRETVEDPDCVFDGEGPEFGGGAGRPMDGKVKEVGTGPLHGGLDVALGNAVLELGMRGTEIILLGLSVAVKLEDSRSESAVVGVIPFDGEAVRAGKFLKVVLAVDGLRGVGRKLRVDEDVAGAVISEEGAAGVTQLFRAVGVRKTPVDRRMKVISGNAIARG